MQNTILRSTEPMNYPGEGRMKGVAYDTAWVARVKDEQGKPLFPQCIKWLLENQNPDGSWGSSVNHAQDHILSTLISIISLAEMNYQRFQERIEFGESYIWDQIDELGKEDRRLAGIELIFPALMEEAQKIGLNLPFHEHKYEKERRIKLKKIDKSLWYSKTTTLPYSLEFLGKDLDTEKAKSLISENGSVFNSPSTTAYVLQHTGILDAYNYLWRTLMYTGDGSIMTVHPFEIFEGSWMIYNYLIGGMDTCNIFGKYSNFFLQCMSPKGVGASVYFPLPDADDTAIVAKILAHNGVFVPLSVFKPYFTGSHFVTYGFETESSVTTNLHILEFLKEYKDIPQVQDITEHILKFLWKEIKNPGYWIDKWHASVYYPTSHAIIALSELDNLLASKSISWILKNQNENGTWGMKGGSIEETAYAVQGLLYYHMHVEHIDLECVSKAIPYLNTSIKKIEHPEFWVAKGLYVPTNILTSTVISALNMYRMVTKSMYPQFG